MSEQRPQQPLKEFRAGTITASIWPERNGQAGKGHPQFTIRVQKRYRDERSGQWKTTAYFRPDDLPKLALVAEKAFEHIALRTYDSSAAAGAQQETHAK